MLGKVTRSLQGRVAQLRMSKSFGAICSSRVEVRVSSCTSSCSVHILFFSKTVVITSIARSQYGNSYN